MRVLRAVCETSVTFWDSSIEEKMDRDVAPVEGATYTEKEMRVFVQRAERAEALARRAARVAAASVPDREATAHRRAFVPPSRPVRVRVDEAPRRVRLPPPPFRGETETARQFRAPDASAYVREPATAAAAAAATAEPKQRRPRGATGCTEAAEAYAAAAQRGAAAVPSRGRMSDWGCSAANTVRAEGRFEGESTARASFTGRRGRASAPAAAAVPVPPARKARPPFVGVTASGEAYAAPPRGAAPATPAAHRSPYDLHTDARRPDDRTFRSETGEAHRWRGPATARAYVYCGGGKWRPAG